MAGKFDPLLGEYREKDGIDGTDVPSYETDPLSIHRDQNTPQTMTGLADGYLKLTSGVIGTGTVDLSAYLPANGATTGATSQSQVFTNGITLNATSIVTDTTTGLKIGTGTTQKIAFYNSTPIVKPVATLDLGTVLSNLGLRVAGTAYPITTSGTVTFSGTFKHSGSTLSFYNATGITKPAATVDLGTVLSNLGLRTAGTAYPITTSGTVALSGTVGLGVTTITDTSTAALKVTGTNGDAFTVDTTNMKVVVGGTTHQIGFTGDEGMIVLTTDVVTINDDLKVASDSYGVWVGAGSDAKITYDGTNMIINPKVVGSGYLSIAGDLNVNANDIYTTGAIKGVHKAADGTAAVADGTYTTGIGGTTNGTITIKDGIITAVQQAVA
jgi:hypothetical protein